MAQEIINVGVTANDGLGDPIRTAYIKCNNNFNQLFARAQPNPPATLIGTVGDVAGMYAYDSTYFYYCFADYDGSSIIWAEVTQVGNISLPAITYGTSSVEIVAVDGNIAVNVDGTGNVVVFTSSGVNVTGTVSATGNVTGGNIRTTGQISTSGTTITNTLTANTVNAVNMSLSGNVTSSANITGNVTAGNIFTAGIVSAAGNVSGQFFIGNGAFLTGIVGGGGGSGGGSFIANGLSRVNIPATSGNVQVDVGLFGQVAEFSGSGLTLTGAITAGIGSLSSLTVAGSTITNSLQSNTTVSATGNVTGGNLNSAGTVHTSTVSASGNITGANLITGGSVSAVGNITGAYIYGNGAFLTGITSGGGGGDYGDANVAAYLPTYTGNLGGVLTTASQPAITDLGSLNSLTVNGLGAIALTPVGNSINISPSFGGTIKINSSGLGSINNMVIGNMTPAQGTFTNLSVTGNIVGSNFAITGDVSTTGNVTGQYLIGDGSFITNIGVGTTYGNANVAAYLPTYTGNITAGNIAVDNNQIIGGNLTVNNVNAQSNVNVVNTVNTNKVIGQLTGTVNGVNTTYGVWDFGSITGTTFESPIAWIFAQTSAGNIDMGTITVPSSNNIDIGTIY